MKNYYDKTYYNWQVQWGLLGALIDTWKFQPYIKETDAVLDFGCGGGYILEQLQCKEKYGVDINPIAQEEAKKRGVHIYETIEQLPQNMKFDRIISHHALEHVDTPAHILRALKDKLRPDGVAVHVVPIDDWRNEKTYIPTNVSKHLYTWTPLLLGNLFADCGYEIRSIKILHHAWLPFSKTLYPILPKPLYHFGCMLWSFLTRNRQMIIIASLPQSARD